MSEPVGDLGGDSLPQRSPDVRTLSFLGSAIGCVVAVLSGRVAANGDPQGWFFCAVGSGVALASLALGSSAVSVGDGVVSVRNGWRRRRIPIAMIDSVGATVAAGVGRGSANRTLIPAIHCHEGRPVAVLALIVEPSLRRRSVGQDAFDRLVGALRTAIAAQGGPSADDPTSGRPDRDCR